MTGLDTFPILPWLGVCAVVALVARYRGATTKTIVGASLLGFVLSVLAFGVVSMAGIVASVVAVVFPAVWLMLFLLVRWFGRHRTV